MPPQCLRTDDAARELRLARQVSWGCSDAGRRRRQARATQGQAHWERGWPRALAVAPATDGTGGHNHHRSSSSTAGALYPPSRCVKQGHLQVSDMHHIYYEVHGKPGGIPALVVHGGPGAGCYARHACFFDPGVYCVVLVDQRGCGRSRPRGCLLGNTTAALVADFEALRQHLDLQGWVLLGGSWGVALSLAYAQSYPDRVWGLILRGVCLMRPKEIHWMLSGGCAALRPLSWERFVNHLTAEESHSPLLGYYARLLSPDRSIQEAAAKSWMLWEQAVGVGSTQDMLVWDGSQWGSVAPPLDANGMRSSSPSNQGSGSLGTFKASSQERYKGREGQKAWREHTNYNGTKSMLNRPERRNDDVMGNDTDVRGTLLIQRGTTIRSGVYNDGLRRSPKVSSHASLLKRGLAFEGDSSMSGFVAQALLTCHYSIHGGFLLREPLLKHMYLVKQIPCIVVQGQLDFVCPLVTAIDLHRTWPQAEIRLIPGAGHSMYDTGILHELLAATRLMANWVARHSNMGS